MKRRLHHQYQQQNVYCCQWRKVVLGFMCVITAALIILQLLYMPPSVKNHYFKFAPATPKIAFLFIARNRLPLDFVWQRFFQETEESKFSIYIHSRPGFMFTKGTTRCTYFYGRQLSDSIQVDWGEASMIQAERILLRKALQDPANQRFVFASDSCIPLYNFSYTYDYIMSSPKSFVDSFSDTKEGRYNPKMSGRIPVEKWRKGSQWTALIRKHAEVVAADNTVFPAFQLHCKRKPLPEFWRQEAMTADTSKIHNCIPDEHYVQTLLAMKGFEGEINHWTVTYTLWKSAKARERQGWHPMTFKHADATANLISDIKGIDHIYYETEYRTEWCSTKEKIRPCFLFARKFSRGAAFRLLNQVYFSTSHPFVDWDLIAQPVTLKVVFQQVCLQKKFPTNLLRVKFESCPGCPYFSNVSSLLLIALPPLRVGTTLLHSSISPASNGSSGNSFVQSLH